MKLYSSAMITVDPRDYRSFCFRGEGRANVVISAKNRVTGTRIVWRFAKARKSGLFTLKAKSELVNRYMETMVSPFFSPEYLVAPSIIEMSVADVHQLAKIPSVLGNVRFESFEELFTVPESLSFLPLNTVPQGVTTISALQMLDATQIPKHVLDVSGETITVEIKPKQGFYQAHPGVGLPYCNNCVLQLEKCGSDHFSEMYDFCPIDLFSGVEYRVRSALRELFHNPHRNLRLFLNGDLIHADERPSEINDISKAVFKNGEGSLEDLILALSLVLTGSNSLESFNLYKDSVLEQILNGQQVDTIGIVRANQLFCSLPSQVQKEMMDKSYLPSRGLECLEQTDVRSLVERYLLAATMKDCSVMISLCLTNPQSDEINVITLPNGINFAYTIKIVDLDPKSPKNLLNAISRYMAGAKLLRHGHVVRRPCVRT